MSAHKEPEWVGVAPKANFSDPTLLEAKASDWFDSRLEQAYRLIDEVLDAANCAQDHLRKAAEAVEDADLALEAGA